MNDTIYSRFHQYAIRHPNATAVIEDGKLYTYGQIDSMADAIMSRFYDKRYRYVGIVMNHSAEMIAAIFAVLKSGAAYVPAEPSLPKDRIDFMMKSAGVKLIITDEFCKGMEFPVKSMSDRSTPNSPAYVLYTSGTTGRPKGVVVKNSNVVNYCEAFYNEFHVHRGDIMLQYSVCSFDIFVEEVFASLLNGAAIAIPTENDKQDITALMEFVDLHGVTVISGFPYLLADMNKLSAIPGCLRLLISGGDVLRGSYIDRLKDSGVTIYNTYGPSETTVCATYQRCDNIQPLADGTYPVGTPVKGVEVMILDDNLKKVRQGEVGEICILGRGVSDGYLGNPPEQKNFVTTREGRRLYRSGDMGYVDRKGRIAFLHRKDSQVMIMGKRVEPEEVESVLNASPDIETGVVCPFTDKRGLSYLVAYFVPKHRKISVQGIKKWLASKLTDFMIPEFFVELSKLPLTPRGKVDRSALPGVAKQ